MTRSALLKTSSVLWIIWGLFHLLLGIGLLYLFFIGDEALGIALVADDPLFAGLFEARDPVVRANLMNYSWDIAWFGLVTTIGATFIWKQSSNAVFLCALVAGLADFGYFVFVDVPGYAPPVGQAMTFISASAIILSLYAVFGKKNARQPQ